MPIPALRLWTDQNSRLSPVYPKNVFVFAVCKWCGKHIGGNRYRDRRFSGRPGPNRVCARCKEAFRSMDSRLAAARFYERHRLEILERKRLRRIAGRALACL
jgi:hypothetical protein